MKLFTKHCLFVLAIIVSPVFVLAQVPTISYYFPDPLPSNHKGYGGDVPGFLIDSTLFFQYQTTIGKFCLAKYEYNSGSITLVPNPSSADVGFFGNPITVGKVLYFSYLNASGKRQLAKYDGTVLTLIPNLSSLDGGFAGLTVVLGNTLYFAYEDAAGKQQLAKYDGVTLTLIPKLSSIDRGYTGDGIVFKNSIYFGYNSDSKNMLAKYDGVKLTVFPNPSTTHNGYGGSPFIWKDSLYFKYQFADNKYQLGKLNGASLELIPNILTEHFGYDRETKPIVFNDAIYFQYNSNEYFKSYLAKYDGKSLTLIPNLSSKDYGYKGVPFIFDSKLYIQYADSSGNYYLGKYDGTKISIIPSPPAPYSPGPFPKFQYGGLPLVMEGNLYVRYYTYFINGYGVRILRSNLARYDGNNIMLIPNRSEGDEGYNAYAESPDPVVMNNSIYFKYGSGGGLARYNGGDSLTLLKDGSGIAYSYYQFPVVIGNILYFRANLTSYYALGKFVDNSMPLPLSLMSITANQKNAKALLQWQTTNEVNVSHFNIQRSTDGVNFSSIGNVAAKGDGSYSYNDDQSSIIPQPSTLYYRLQMVDKDGSIAYS